MNSVIQPSQVVGRGGAALAGAPSGGAVVNHESLGRMGSALVESMRTRTDPQERIAAARAAVAAIQGGQIMGTEGRPGGCEVTDEWGED